MRLMDWWGGVYTVCTYAGACQGISQAAHGGGCLQASDTIFSLSQHAEADSVNCSELDTPVESQAGVLDGASGVMEAEGYMDNIYSQVLDSPLDISQEVLDSLNEESMDFSAQYSNRANFSIPWLRNERRIP